MNQSLQMQKLELKALKQPVEYRPGGLVPGPEGINRMSLDQRTLC